MCVYFWDDFCTVMYMFMCIHTYIHMYIHMYIHTYTHTHTCMRTYIHTYIRMYICTVKFVVFEESSEIVKATTCKKRTSLV